MARVWTSVCAIAGFAALGVTMVSSSANGDTGRTPDRECHPGNHIRVTVGKVGTGNRVGGRSEGSFQAGKVIIGGKVIDAAPGETVDVRIPGRCASETPSPSPTHR